MPALPALRTTPQPSPLVQPVIFGGQQGAANLVGPKGIPNVGPGGSVTNAQSMEQQGVDPQTIFHSTGWYHAPDGQWKWVLSDQGASLNMNRFTNTGRDLSDPDTPSTLTLRYGANQTLPEVLNHPNLYKTYPQLAKTQVEKLPKDLDSANLVADYNPTTNTVRLSSDRTAKDITSTLLHELQHGVQRIEGFGRGGGEEQFYPKNYSDMAAPVYKTWNKLTPQVRAAGVEDPLHLRNLILARDSGVDPALLGTDAEKYIKEELAKLPPDLSKQFMSAVNNLAPIRAIEKEAYQKYKNLAGETESRQVQSQFETKDWTQLPTQMPGFAPAEQQLVTTGVPGRITPTTYAPGRQYQQDTPGPPEAPPDPLVDQTQQAYPWTGGINYNLLNSTQNGDPTNTGRKLEFYPADEQYNPKPGSPTIEVFDPSMGPRDIMGELLSHHLPKTDSTVAGLRDQMIQSMTPEQKSGIYGDYLDEHHSGLTQDSFDSWLNKQGGDSFFRGLPSGQWKPEDYTPEQINLYHRLEQHLETNYGQPQPQPQPQPSNGM